MAKDKDPAVAAILELGDTVDASFQVLDKEAKAAAEGLTELKSEVRDGFRAHASRISVIEREGLRGGPAQSEPEMYVRAEDGSRVRLLRPSETLASLHGSPGAGAGEVVRAVATGKWTPEAQKAALDGGQVTGGGYLLSPGVSATIIDLARARSAVVASGAMTVPMGQWGEMKLATLTADPSVQWRAPNQAITPSDPTFGGVTLRARTLAVLSKIPIELVEDAANLEPFVESVFAQAIAAEIDRVALVGIGAAEEPLGIENTTGVGTATSVGSPLYDDFTDAQATVRAANVEPTAAILNPRDIGTLAKLKGTSNDHYIEPPAALASITFRHTTNVPKNRGGGGAESLAFVGDFSNLWLGIRTALVIEASREASDTSGSAFANLQLWVRGYIRMDVAVVRPSAFVVLSGITT